MIVALAMLEPQGHSRLLEPLALFMGLAQLQSPRVQVQTDFVPNGMFLQRGLKRFHQLPLVEIMKGYYTLLLMGQPLIQVIVLLNAPSL